METLADKTEVGSFYLFSGPKHSFSLEFLQNIIFRCRNRMLDPLLKFLISWDRFIREETTIQITLAIKVIEYVWCQGLLSESGQTERRKMLLSYVLCFQSLTAQ